MSCLKFVYELAGKFCQYPVSAARINIVSECDELRAESKSDKVVKMILDGEQVLEGVSKTFVRYPGEEHSAWLQRLTHLHCQNQVTQCGHYSSSFSRYY